MGGEGEGEGEAEAEGDGELSGSDTWRDTTSNPAVDEASPAFFSAMLST